MSFQVPADAYARFMGRYADPLARAFAALEPERPVRFVAFTNEEPPFFRSGQQGSAVHARAARARGERIAPMIALEMLGYYDDRPGSQRYPPLFRAFYPDCGDFLGFVSDFRSRAVMRRGTRRSPGRCSRESPVRYETSSA